MERTLEKLKKIRSDLKSRYFERDDVIDGAFCALLTGSHLLLIGPPGTAKSSLLRSFASGIGGKFFRIVLNPDITREDIVGPLDPAAVRNGEWRRKWSKWS